MTKRAAAPARAIDPVNSAVSRSLAAGSIAAATVVALGLAAWFASGAGPAGAHGLQAWLDRLGRLEPAAVVFVGLVLVTLTPIVQLLAALVAFARLREWRHAGVAAAVLAVVLGSGVVALMVAEGG